MKENADENFTVYPNPARSFLNVEVKIENAELKLYDVSGSEIEIRVVSKNESKVKIDASNLATGVYFLKVKSHKGTAVKKIIISE